MYFAYVSMPGGCLQDGIMSDFLAVPCCPVQVITWRLWLVAGVGGLLFTFHSDTSVFAILFPYFSRLIMDYPLVKICFAALRHWSWFLPIHFFFRLACTDTNASDSGDSHVQSVENGNTSALRCVCLPKVSRIVYSNNCMRSALISFSAPSPAAIPENCTEVPMSHFCTLTISRLGRCVAWRKM